MNERPLYLRPWCILLVGIGGAAGTLARYLVSLIVPTALQLPWPTLTVNIVGAFLLGVLLEGLARRGHDEGRRRMLRLLIGTGFMGGFTTYSSLAVETEQLLQAGRVWESIGYGLTTVVVGLLASFLGMWIAAVHHRSVVRRLVARRSTADAEAAS
ncbi:MAG: fluoride efflux transporter CrcB [Microbacteriaceae bacterium]|nr:MAG: fluoride efflux transporter CrcB [Microbacteriaceae bacterium]